MRTLRAANLSDAMRIFTPGIAVPRIAHEMGGISSALRLVTALMRDFRFRVILWALKDWGIEGLLYEALWRETLSRK